MSAVDTDPAATADHLDGRGLLRRSAGWTVVVVLVTVAAYAAGIATETGRDLRRLAEKVAVAQQSEIAAMSALLEARGVASPPDTGRSAGDGGSPSDTRNHR